MSSPIPAAIMNGGSLSDSDVKNKVNVAVGLGIPVPGPPADTRSKVKKIKYRVKSVIKRLCCICGSRAIRQYYGTLACEGCKNFYRKTVMMNKVYICVGKISGSCIISFSQGLKNCRSCQLKKCESAGMTKLAVKLDLNSRKPSLPISAPDIIRKLSKAYLNIFKSYDRNIQSVHIKPLLLSDKPLETMTTSYKAAMFSQLCSYYQPLVNEIVQFASLIPGFGELPPDDQLILLKTGFIDVWLILNATRLTHVQDSITLSGGEQIPICEVTTVYTKDYVTSIMDLSDEFKSLKLLHSDKAVLMALALTCSERPNLLEKEQVNDLQSSISSSMAEFMRLRRPSKPEFTKKVMSLLTNINDVGKQHSLLLNVYRTEVDKLSVTPVITELFDLHPPQAYKES